jgi:uncharacterized membrane protein YraQ (UPF0718 family)/zinc transporter ZupT
MVGCAIMSAALWVPLLAVALGTTLSFIGGARPRILLPIRGFALAAVVTSVAAHLVPEAMSAVGVGALVAFAVGLWLPHWLSQAQRRLAKHSDHRRIAAEVGFVAVLVHQVGDGLALGALGASARGANWDLLLGIAAHTVPLAAVVTLPFLARGWRQVTARAGLLAAANAVGVLAARSLGELHAEVLPWFSAVVAGTLLHILSHDEPAIARPAGLRAIEVAAMVAGVVVPTLLAADDEHRVVAAMAALALSIAPLLLIGLAITVLLRTAAPAVRWTSAQSAGVFRGVAAAAAAALRAPSCACEVVTSVPVSEPAPGDPRSLNARPSAQQLAFLLIAPELHVGTLIATMWLFGWRWAALRGFVAMAAAAGAVALLRRMGETRGMRGSASPRASAEPPAGPRWSRLPLRDVLAETFVHAGPWLAAGVVVATWLQVALPADWLAASPSSTIVALPLAVALVAALTYVCAWSATPIAAVLVTQGLSPALALAGLIIGTLTNRDVLRVLGATTGTRSWRAIALVAAAVAAVAALVSVAHLAPGFSPYPALPRQVQLACALLLGAGCLLSLWRYGLTAWLEPLLSDAASHHHHQHEEAEPCRDGCHDADALGPPSSSAPITAAPAPAARQGAAVSPHPHDHAHPHASGDAHEHTHDHAHDHTHGDDHGHRHL